MIVPQFWAEARAQHRERGRQITIRRFGWSDESEAQAQSMAEQRAAQALQRALAGEKLPRREPKVPYNGAQGVPIREEIVARQGDVIITRNAYGARCLNTPDVLFADVDFDERRSMVVGAILSMALTIVAMAIGWHRGSFLIGLGGVVLAIILGQLIGVLLHLARVRIAGGAPQITRTRIERFMSTHPAWGLRLYRTPNGWRALVTHRTFAPDDPEVAAFFQAIGADPLYVRMCRNQQCFRARVSAKPWRIGIATHLKPRPGVWPVRPEAMAKRNAWIAHYERETLRYAACAFVAALGNPRVDAKVVAVSTLHDRSCNSMAAGLPLG